MSCTRTRALDHFVVDVSENVCFKVKNTTLIFYSVRKTRISKSTREKKYMEREGKKQNKGCCCVLTLTRIFKSVVTGHRLQSPLDGVE